MLSYFIEYLQKVSNNIGVVPKKKKPPRRRVAVCNIHPPLAEGPIPLGSEAAHMPRLPGVFSLSTWELDRKVRAHAP